MPPERWRPKRSEAQRGNASLRFGLHRPCPGSSRRREWPGGDFADSSGRLVMSAGGAAGGAAAAAAAIAQAIKASGAIVRVAPDDFLQILGRQKEPLVVHATGGFFSTNYQYLSSYKGLAFFTKSPSPLDLPAGCELVIAQKIWIPG